jgi:eukaryotic-like serine/threonine-protein kinase
MEFISGEPLREYVHKHLLNKGQRLELIAKICDGVDHAHQRGVIHRDLKPSNLLVDTTGQPKILDFGVARLTDGDTRATRQTDIGQLVGTLAYMSPEQVLADPGLLDARSDVYSLGIILYELLTERLPYELSRNVREAALTIWEKAPLRLSAFDASYKGDIEIIVAKALEKDKMRRYSSAAALAADIRHYLEDEPITARPPSIVYHLRKSAFSSVFLAIATVLIVLITGSWVTAKYFYASDEAARRVSIWMAATVYGVVVILPLMWVSLRIWRAVMKRLDR